MANPFNILLILTDDQGPWALNGAGTSELDTPNLNRLASRGLRLTNFFCASPVCSPARASILTGNIPSDHGIHDWIRSGNLDKSEMDRLGIVNPYGGYTDETKPIQYLAGQRTYTDALAEQGYRCALSGKWHLGDSMTPQHGFRDRYALGKGGACYYHPDMIEHGRIQVENRYITDLITDKAVTWLEQLADGFSPFYLGVHYTAPHSPWEAEQHPAGDIRHYDACDFASIPDLPDHPDLTTGPVFGTSRRRTNLGGYFAAVTAMDRAVGRLRDVLDRRALWDSTIVVFLSDNGMCMGHHGGWGKGNGTFPQNMYEESVKVPFLIACPQAA
ncbi:MAG: sulfatase-like hydrolase/transferase, partial [Clostridiaceae bacterium]|nr:sulfatase-like hydrolase/transferase [Clostridiaceae bacterium]